ncbi:SWEET sugar transporter [Corchorus capsularis]|uniref:Bidirectional sugar transporter SWEET n=1 Tax=Corchorus capsularis TaxID=210143 RepID=A0A1R3JV05_COCAP|nr:SWEET sugar transporter [Corchorus capsularis]
MAFSLSFIIGIIGNVVSILVFASPMTTFWKVIKKKSTDCYKVVPYITTLLCTSLWTFYGLLKPGGLLIMTVNGAGAIFQFIYVTLFLLYCPQDKKVKTAKLVAVLDIGFLGSVIAVTLLLLNKSLQLTLTGILCAALTIGMYASPLAAMRTVIKTQSVEYMPFLLSFFLFLNAGVWSVYSVLVEDFFIGIPNAIGFLLGSAQLILYSMYKNKPKLQKQVKISTNDGAIIEVSAYKEDDAEEEKSLKQGKVMSKNKSLPRPPVSRLYSLEKLMRTLSWGPYGIHSTLPQDQDDIEEDLP